MTMSGNGHISQWRKRRKPAILVSINLNGGFILLIFFRLACLIIQACKLELIGIKLKSSWDLGFPLYSSQILCIMVSVDSVLTSMEFVRIISEP